MTHSNKPPLVALAFYSLFALTLCSIYALRGRSFWLDEAFIVDFLLTKNPVEVLFAGTLPHMQSFPRVYLMLVDLWHTLQPQSVFWVRFLPFVFGVGAIFVWLLFFYDHFWVQRKLTWAFIVAGGLLLANTHIFYYAFELKQYSAELFFSGFLLTVFYTRSLSIKAKHWFLAGAALLSLFFTYTSIFILFALSLATLFNSKERAAWQQQKKFLLLSAGTGILILFGLYWIDFRPGLAMKGTMTSYWQNYMVGENRTIFDLFKLFLTGWWKTEYGLVNETMAGENAWTVWPIKIIHHPDLRNGLFIGTLLLMVKSFWTDRESPLLAGALLFLIMANGALFNLFPLGPIRLSLYAMPMCILFMVHTFLLLESGLHRLKWIQKIRHLVWIPFLVLILRNGVYVAGAFTVGPFRENISEAYRHIDPLESKIIMISQGNEVIARANPKPPLDVHLIYEKDLPAMTIDLNRPFYYLWAHVPPDWENKEIPPYFQNSHTAKEIFVPKKEQFLGLIFLVPHHSY